MTQAAAESFFTRPNEVDLAALPSDLANLVSLLRARLSASRTVLPARLTGQTRWYGFAASGRESRLLREEFRCWLGPPISSRIADVMPSTDPMDAIALDMVAAGR